MKKLQLIPTMMVCVALITGAGSQAASGAPDAVASQLPTYARVVQVNDYEFMFNDQRGSNITFTVLSSPECTLSFAKSSLVKNFVATTQLTAAPQMAAVPQLDLSCLGEGGLFILDESKRTFASMKVAELTGEKATIIVEGYLYASRKKEYLSLSKIVLNVTGRELKALNN